MVCIADKDMASGIMGNVYKTESSAADFYVNFVPEQEATKASGRKVQVKDSK